MTEWGTEPKPNTTHRWPSSVNCYHSILSVVSTPALFWEACTSQEISNYHTDTKSVSVMGGWLCWQQIVSLVMRFPSRSLIVKVCNLWRSLRVNKVIFEDSTTANIWQLSTFLVDILFSQLSPVSRQWLTLMRTPSQRNKRWWLNKVYRQRRSDELSARMSALRSKVPMGF